MNSDVADRERSVILHGLESPDEEMRRLGVERIHELPASEALPALLDRLGDSSWRVRKAVVERLIASSDSQLVEDALIEALSDGDNSGRRNSAYEALVGIGSRLNDKLLAALESDDVDVRKLVVDVVGGIGDPGCASAMIEMLSDPDPNVRGAAADALAVIADEAAATALQTVAAREDEEPLVRLSALRAMAGIELEIGVDDLASALEAPLLRPAAYALLGQIGDEASVSELLKGLTLTARASREAAMSALLCILSRSDGSKFDDLLRSIRETALSSPQLVTLSIDRIPEADLSTKIMLIQFLGLARDDRAVIPILKAGRDEAIAEIANATLESMGSMTVRGIAGAWSDLDVPDRGGACVLMGAIGGPEALELLISSLDEADSALRASAARALGQLHCIDALGDLVRRLEMAAQEEEPEAEEEVLALIDALSDLAPPGASVNDGHAAEVIGLLAAHMEGAMEDVRLAIATVLGRIGRPEDEDLVARLLKDPSDRVRRAAVEALTRLEPGAASEPLRLALADESALVRIAAANALGGCVSAAVIDDLQRLLHDDEPRVSAAAVRAIGAHCEHDDVDVDQTVALIGHALGMDGMVGLAAIEALGMIGGPSAAHASLAALDRAEPELVQAAVGCIGAHGDAETVAELIGLVSHESWSVRAEAIQVLAERRVTRAVPPILRRLETEQDSFVRDAILRALRQLED